MATILVVDDEISYRESLRNTLNRAGHTIFTAADGPDAIELGLRIHPDIVISDWMLKDSVDGLMVADALRLVDPGLPVIFLTSYATTDQQRQARHRNGLHFVEKPIESDEILRIIENFLPETIHDPSDSDLQTEDTVGAIRFNRSGRVLSENAKAVSILSSLLQASDENISHLSITELLEPKYLELVCRRPNEWHRISSAKKAENLSTSLSSSCSLYCRHWDDLDLSLLIILDSSDESQRDSPPLRLILGEHQQQTNHWPHSAHVLVVDGQLLARRITVETLRRSGCVCHAASNIEEAQRIAEDASDFLVTVIDGEREQERLPGALAKLQQSNPQSMIVGTARSDLRKQFEEAGVRHFLRKPWVITDLIELLNRESERSRATH